MTIGTERVSPYSLDAERSILGAVLLYPEYLTDVAGLKPSDFFREAHRRIFAQMLELEHDGRGVDFLLVTEELRNHGDLERVGGMAYIAGLVDGIPKSTNVEHYAEIVREKARLRATIEAAETMLREAYENDDAKEVIDHAEQALFALGQGRSQTVFVSMRDIMPGVLDQIEAWHAHRGQVSGVPSGLSDLDDMTGGFQPGNLVIVAARPSMGKSAFVLDVACHAARKGKTVLFFSLEMSRIELAVRGISGSARLDGHKLQRGFVTSSEYGRISTAACELAELPLYVDDSPFLTVQDIRHGCRRLKAQSGLDLVIVDYTQLMISEGKTESRALEVAAITRSFKALAKELGVPVLALSQLNRDLERRDNKRPKLSDLRDSGAIEQDADVVLMIYRDEVYHDQTLDRGIAELIIGKQRNGPVGTVRAAWIAEETRFANLQPRQRESA